MDAEEGSSLLRRTQKTEAEPIAAAPSNRLRHGAAFVVIFSVLALVLVSFTQGTSSSLKQPSVTALNGIPTIQSSLMESIDMARAGLVPYGSLKGEELSTLFGLFQTHFERKYMTDEMNTRYDNFQNFLVRADERNARERAAGGTAIHGITKFADMSQAEFKQYFLSSYMKKDNVDKKDKNIPDKDNDKDDKDNKDDKDDKDDKDGKDDKNLKVGMKVQQVIKGVDRETAKEAPFTRAVIKAVAQRLDVDETKVTVSHVQDKHDRVVVVTYVVLVRQDAVKDLRAKVESDHTADLLLEGLVNKGYKVSGVANASVKDVEEGESDGKVSITEINWTGVYVGNVGNQGYCGSCWAFAVAEQVQADGIRQGYFSLTDTLSIEQLLTCDSTKNGIKTDDNGCVGGDPLTALDYVKSVGGLVRASDFPYVESGLDDASLDVEVEDERRLHDQRQLKKNKNKNKNKNMEDEESVKATCSSLENKYAIRVKKYYRLTSEAEMIEYVKTTGPLAICVDANDWDTYTGGVMASCGDSVDHCLQVVGYNVKNNYWIARNQWGNSWGANGYIFLQAGKNTCAIASEAVYTKVGLPLEATNQGKGLSKALPY